MLTNLYWKLWMKSAELDTAEENGAEAIEWIAMVAVVVILLLAVSTVFETGGKTIGQTIVDAVVGLIARIFI